jgi:hypothetical protein
MLRLAFLVAVAVALLFGRWSGFAGVSNGADDGARTISALYDPFESADPPIVAETEIESDDHVSVHRPGPVPWVVIATRVEPSLEFGVGPSQSHARRMDRPPRI